MDATSPNLSLADKLLIIQADVATVRGDLSVYQSTLSGASSTYNVDVPAALQAGIRVALQQLLDDIKAFKLPGTTGVIPGTDPDGTGSQKGKAIPDALQDLIDVLQKGDAYIPDLMADFQKVTDAISAGVTPVGGRQLMQYMNLVCKAAMDMQQDICTSILSIVQRDTSDKRQLSQLLSQLQSARPTKADTATNIASSPDLSTAEKMLMEQFGLDTGSSVMSQDGKTQIWQMNQQNFDACITKVQNLISQTDQNQQQLMILYNQHNSQLTTISELLSKSVEAMSTTQQAIAR